MPLTQLAPPSQHGLYLYTRARTYDRTPELKPLVRLQIPVALVTEPPSD